jgi:hypothetical protein
MIWCRYQIYDILVYKVLLSIEHGYTMIYIYILIYIHINSEAFWMWPVTNKKRVPQWHGKTWSLSSVCSLWAASGVKSETTPGPRLSQRKKNILLEFLTTINPKKKWLWNSENYPLRTELRHNMFATNRCHGVAQYSNCIHLLMPG